MWLMSARSKVVLGALVLILAGLGAGFTIAYCLKSQSSTAPARPFVAQGFERSFGTKGDEGPSIVELTTYARKSDGSWVEVRTTKDPSREIGVLRTFWDVASGTEVTLEPATKSAMTLFLTRSEMRGEISSFESCPPEVNNPAAEHERILGYDAVKVTDEGPGPKKGRQLIESWVVPELACFPVRRSEVLSAGPHNEFKTTGITEGEPPAWMFEVPQDYVERSPTQLSQEWAARFAHRFWPDDVAARMEKRYVAHRVPQAAGQP